MFVFQKRINDKDALVIQNTTECRPVEGADVVAVYVNDDGTFTYAAGKIEGGEVEPGVQPGSLPEVTVSDDGKVLTVVDGAWAAAEAGECSVTSVNGKTGAVVLDASDVGLGTVTEDIATLNDNVGTLTTDVAGIQENKQNKLTAGTGIAITEQGVISVTNGVSFTVVEELPAEGETNVIYLVAEETAEQDIYAEYIWVDGSFEKIGTTVTPISNYVPNTRTIAGNTLEADISASTLKTSLDLVKADVGLGNVDNTSDANKPVSTATQTALNAKQDTLVSGTNIKTVNGVSILGSGNIATPTFDPTAIAGYDATKTQVLKHIQGTLTWVDSGEVTQEGNEVTLP